MRKPVLPAMGLQVVGPVGPVGPVAFFSMVGSSTGSAEANWVAAAMRARVENPESNMVGVREDLQ